MGWMVDESEFEVLTMVELLLLVRLGLQYVEFLICTNQLKREREER